MPVLRGAVTFSRFRAESTGDGFPQDLKRWLTKGLKAHAFEPIDRKSPDERAAGFVEVENQEATEFSPGSLFRGEYVLFGFRIDQLKVPGSVVRSELNKWAANFEQEKGRAPSRVEKAEARGNIEHLLRARATPRTKVHDVSWNLKTHQVQVWAASRKAVDEIVLAVEGALSAKLEPLVPASLAARAGIAEDALGPTPELIGADLSAEVNHGEA
ncbi:recombination-associated protein RdgC [Myxococcaceae bacterium GXIMD 01537]